MTRATLPPVESAHTSDTCPHAPFCSAATGCHGGVCPRGWSVTTELSGDVWYAVSWSSPQGPCHQSQPGAGPALEMPPRWARPGRVAPSKTKRGR